MFMASLASRKCLKSEQKTGLLRKNKENFSVYVITARYTATPLTSFIFNNLSVFVNRKAEALLILLSVNVCRLKRDTEFEL